MSYVRSVLQPGEKVILIGRLSWIVYHRAILLLIVGIILIVLERILWGETTVVILITAALFGALTIMAAIQGWFARWITEIAVTDRRVIYKRGFINRHTIEMNMDKVATVDVDQSVLGRLLNYGTVTVQGTGMSFEPLRRIESPLALRNAIIAK
jgi:membrane protein YdbS with pleckstrin-like domain